MRFTFPNGFGIKRKTFFFGLIFLLSFQFSEAQSPLSPARAFNIFVRNGASVSGSEIQGPLALGGDLTLTGQITVASQNAGTFKVSNTAIGLLIGGKVNYTSGNSLNLNSNAYLKIGDCTGSKIWYTDNNGASSNMQVTSGSYNTSPRINLQTSANNLGVSELVNPVCEGNLIDFGAAFIQLQSNSTSISSCANNLQLYQPNGTIITDYSNLTNEVRCNLSTGLNILNIPGTSLNAIQQFKFDNQQPDANHYLVININAPGVFNFEGIKSSNLGSSEGAYVLYNFYNTTNLTINAKDQVPGTIFAPFADITKSDNRNLIGQVIGQSFTMTDGLVQYALFTSPVAGCGGCILPDVPAIVGATAVCKSEVTTLINTTPGGTWSSMDTLIATVDANGKVKGISPGVTTIVYAVSNACGTTSKSQLMTVNAAPSKPVITANSTTDFCEGGSVTLASSFTDFNQWYMDGSKIPGATNNTYLATLAGRYSLVVYSATGCGSVPANSVYVTTSPTPNKPVITPSGSLVLCPGDYVDLFVNKSDHSNDDHHDPNYSYQWFKDAVILPGETDNVLRVTQSGVYTVTITNASGCISVPSDGTTVTINAATNLSPITGANALCLGTSTTLSNTTAGGVWSSSNTNVATVNTSTGLVTGVKAGIADIIYTVTSGASCSNSVKKTILVNELPVITDIIGVSNICVNTSSQLQNNTSGGIWSSSNTAIATVSNNGLVQGIIAGTATISYTISNENNCTAVATKDVLVADLPVVSANIVPKDQICVNTSVTLSNNTAGGVWSSSNKNVATVTANGIVTGIRAGTAIIKYTVTNNSGCDNAAATTITVNAIPVTAVITYNGSTSFCEGGSLVLTSSAVNGNQWFRNGLLIASGNGLQTYTATSTGNYSVTVVSSTGCEGLPSNVVNVTVNTIPNIPVVTAGSSANICTGGSVLLSSSNPSGNQWYKNGIIINGETGNTYLASKAGSYAVKATSNNCNSNLSNAIDVVVNANPGIPSISAGNTNICIGEMAVLTANPVGTVSAYQWYLNGSLISGATSATYNAILAGDYTVTVTNASGCSTSSEDIVTVVVNNLPVQPTITAGGPTTFCSGGSVLLTSSSATGNAWYKDGVAIILKNGGQTYTANSAGVYTVVVSNASGCNSIPSNGTTVTINSLPSKPSINTSDLTTICSPGTASLNSSSAIGNQWYKDLVLIPGATNATYVASTTGNYTVIITNGSGCASVASEGIEITVNTGTQVPSVISLSSTTFCAGGSVNLLSSSTTANTNQWIKDGVDIPGATASFYSATNAGVYSVRVNNIASCVDGTSAGTTVTVNPNPNVPAITGNSSVCKNATTTLTNATAGGVWASDNDAIATVSLTGVVTGIKQGTANISYTVTQTGCTNNANQVVTVNPLPTIGSISGPSTVCVNSTITLKNNTSGGVYTSNNLTIASVDPNTGIVTGIAAGTTSIVYTVTSALGCTNATSKNITVNSLPTVSPITGNNPICVGRGVTLSNGTANGVWSSDDISIAAINSLGIATGVSAGSTIIRYTVTSNKCANEATVTLVVNAIPTVAAITGNTSVCIGSTSTLANSTPGGVWTSNNSAVATVNSSGLVTGISTGTAEINYTVTSGSGCQTAVRTSFTVLGIPSAPIITPETATTFCVGDSVVLVGNSFRNNQWYKDAVAITGATGVYYVASSSGSYSLQTENGNGCQSTASNAILVTANSLPATPVISSGSATSFCSGGSVVLTATPATSYQWYRNNIIITGATNISYTADRSGSYSVITTNASGCSGSSSNLIAVTVNSLPSTPIINNNGLASFCKGGASVLSTNNLTGNQWYNNGVIIAGATSQTYTATISGIYTVIRTNSSGCVSAPSLPVTITVIDLPALPIISAGGPLTFCDGNSVTLTSSSATGNQWYRNNKIIPNAISATYAASTSGNYSVIVTNAGSCTNTSTSTTVTVNKNPNVSPITGDLNVCSGGSSQLSSATAGGVWSSGNNLVATVNASGLVTAVSTGVAPILYKVTNNNACATTVVKPINVQATPTIPTLTAGGPTTFCSGNNVILSSSASNGNQWYKNNVILVGETDQQLKVNVSGNYSVIVTNGNGCISDGSSTPTAVTVNALPSKPIITAVGNTVFCAGGTVQLNSSAATGNQWYRNGVLITGAINATYIANSTGQYTVQVTNLSGCSSLTSDITYVYTMSLPSTPIVSSDGPLTFCSGDSVLLSSSSNSGNQWYKNGLPITGATSPTYTANTAGVYAVIITSSNACTSAVSDGTSVTVNSLPIINPIVGATTICVNENSQFTNTNSGGIWSSKNVSIAIVDSQNGIVKGQSIGSTIISYTLTDANGCSDKVIKPLLVTPLPSKPVISYNGPTVFCAGGSITLTSTFAYTYQWFKNGTIIVGATSRNYLVNATGNYSVITTNILGCTGTKSDAVEIVVNDIPSIPVISAGSATTFCEGGSVILKSSALIGNQWFKDGIIIKGATSQSLIVSSAGLYTVLTTNVSGCVSAISAGTSVTVNALPVLTRIAGPRVVCVGSSVTLSNSTTSGIWTSNDVSIATINSSTGVTNGIAAGLTTINYTVTNASGCVSTVSTVFKVTTTPELATISSNTPTSFCAGGSVDLISSSSAGNQWYNNGILIPGATAQIFTAVASGNYSVMVTSGLGCISDGSSLATAVTVYTLPTVAPITGTTNLCVNSTSQLSNATVAGVWSSSNDGIASINPVSGLVTGITAGSSNITYLVSNLNGCTATATAVVSVFALPSQPTITVSGNTIFCEGSSVVLTSSTASSYQWYKNGTIISGSISINYTATSSGTYTVKVGNSNSCISNESAGIPVTVNSIPATPILSAAGPTTFCAGGSVILRSSSVTGNQWFKDGVVMSGETAQTILIQASGNYTVTNNINECVSLVSNSIAVIVNALPATPVISSTGSLQFCAGGTVLLSSTASTSYQWVKDGSVLANQTSQNYSAAATGNYWVTVKDINGCGSANSNIKSVLVNQVPGKPTITSDNPTSFCLGDSSILMSSSSSGNQWYKDGSIIVGATAANYIAKSAGNYTVIVTNASNCVSLSSAAVLVTVNPLPATPLITINGSSSMCKGDSLVLQSSAATGNQWYYFGFAIPGAKSNTLATKIAGNYSLVVTDANACVSTTSTIQSIVVNDLPATPVITSSGATVFCKGNAVTLTSSAASSYQWTLNGTAIAGATSQTLVALNTGIYGVSITNGNTCASASNFGKPVYAIPLPIGTILGNPIQYVCTNSFIRLEAVGGYNYKWFKNGTEIIGTSKNVLLVTSSGTYSVTLINEAGCETKVDKTIQVLLIQKPKVDYIYDSYCANKIVSFQSTSDVSSSGPVFYTWTDGAFINKFSSSSPSYVFAKSGTYNIKLVVTPYFCPISADSTIKPVKIDDPIPGIRMPSVDVANNDLVQLQARSFGTNYLWAPSTYLSSATVPNPTIQATAQQEYKITIGQPSGCTTVDSLLVRIHDQNKIYIPTVFSPNGDGLNDKLYLNYVGIRQLKVFRIYNRWGKIMYETTNMNEGWDGTLYGVQQPMDSYTVIVEAVDKNGTLLRTQGTITLLR